MHQENIGLWERAYLAALSGHSVQAFESPETRAQACKKDADAAMHVFAEHALAYAKLISGMGRHQSANAENPQATAIPEESAKDK